MPTTWNSAENGIREPDLSQISSESAISVFVVFTSIEMTLRAFEKARDIAGPLGGGIVIVAVQVVPFPLQLNEPPVSMEFVIRRFEEKAGELGDKTSVSAYLCRDPMEALKRVLNPNCPIVIGFVKKWWPTRNERIAGKLHRAGYNVISVKTE